MTKAGKSRTAGHDQPDIVLIEDETLIRQMLQIMLRRERGWKRVTGFGNGAEGLAHCLKSPPDLLIADLDVPGKTGWEIAAELKKKAPRTRILILTSNVRRHKPADFMKLGVNGYVAKTAPYAQLLQAIDGVLSGALYFSADPDEARQGHGHSRSDADPLTLLSELEIAIARLVVAGLASKEIAAQRGLTVRSIDKHRSNIMRKLGVRQAAGLVRLCVLHGIK